MSSVVELIRRGHPRDPAISAPGRNPLTYSGLRELSHRTISVLNRAGIGRHDRIAMVLNNGPEFAGAFLAISVGATIAPLNPDCSADEFEVSLTDLMPKILLIERNLKSAVRDVAASRGIPAVELVPLPDEPAGTFMLVPEYPISNGSREGSFGGSDDIALILCTSGTTSRPKMVPLRQANLFASADHIGKTLRLSRADVCLNIMPLFHIHGLVGSVLSSIGAGGMVSCAPGFNAMKFFSWYAEVRPTWFTAVPTMHQAILSRAERQPDGIEGGRLRFIRSSSASLQAGLMTRLESAFSVPVIDSYGMTEAAHQVASNPLPPGHRLPGSVGLAAGPEIAIMNDAAGLVRRGQIGEIVIRGPNIMSGYLHNSAANEEAFRNDWFRTGDQGYLDPDGYLRITGRLKELINRGGEKINPLEVEMILMGYPGVQQAVVFATPHARLGEEVAAGVVLRDGTSISAYALRQFVSEHLSDSKVPRKIVFIKEIPKGPTGKIRRTGLAERLNLA